MTTVPFTPPPGSDGLSVEEKLDYLQALWGRIVSQPADDKAGRIRVAYKECEDDQVR